MNTRALLVTSAFVLGAAGIAASFLPVELLDALGAVPATPTRLIVQLLGALLFGFAMVNWAARGNAMGGIYGRPIAIGNLTHFVIGGLALSRAVLDGATEPAVMVAAALYVVFAVSFALVVFRSPV